ncbi:MAG TPA: hypothetical protein VGG33_29320 [Polyangia bacterium]
MRKATQESAAPAELLAEPVVANFANRARDLVDRLKEEAVAHPFRTAGWAAGAGFVLGGGIFTPLTGRTVKASLQLALRLAILPALTRGVAQIGSRLLENSQRAEQH